MGQYFFSAEALSKRYSKIEDFESLDYIFEQPENDIYISNLTPVELAEKLSGLRAEHVISDIQMRYALRIFGNDIKNRVIMVPYYDEHMETASGIAVRHNLSAISAIEIAVAMGIVADRLVFVATGRDICNAARAEGLEVLNPED